MRASLPATGRRCRAGVAVVFFALLLPPVALCTLALVVDVGSLYATKAWLQTIADVAVLTAAASSDGSQPFDLQDPEARAVVAQTAEANGLGPGFFTVSTAQGPDDLLLTVSADVRYPAQTFFLAALGLSAGTIGIHASAQVTPGAAAPQRARSTE